MSKETNIKIHGTLQVLMMYQVKNHRSFIQNPTKLMELSTKSLWFFTKLLGLIRNLCGSIFCHETFFSTLRTLKWFRSNGSSPGYTITTFKVPWILIFVSFDISSPVEAFHIYGAILGDSVKNRFFLECGFWKTNAVWKISVLQEMSSVTCFFCRFE